MIKNKKISKIYFHNFRSYTQEVFNIRKDANIILLYGNNGLGKTAFFDGIEWGLTGTLKRYNKPAKEKNEYPILANVFKENNIVPQVEIFFSDNSSLLRKVVGKGGRDFNTGIIANDFNIDNNLLNPYYKGYVNFSDNFAFSQFLSQELISMFIRGTKDTDRYEALVNLFGLSKYNQYNSFFKDVISKTLNRKDLLSIKIKDLQNQIKLLESSVVAHTIDIKIKEDELNSLIKSKIDFTNQHILLGELKSTKALYIQNRKAHSEKLELIKSKSNDLDYLNSSYTEKEKVLYQIEALNKQKDTIKNHIEVLEKYKNLDYVLKNENVYSHFKSNDSKVDILDEIYHNKQKTYELLHKVITDIRDESFYKLKDVSFKKSHLINEYIELKVSISNIKQHMHELESEFDEKSSLKQEFLRVTIKHLQNNTNIKNCPICNNSIELDTSLNNLIREINIESDSIFNDLRKSIDECRDNLNNSNQRLKQLRILIQSSTKESIEEIKDDIIIIENELKALKEDKKIHDKVSQILNQYTIAVDQVMMEFGEIYEYMKKNSILDNLESFKHQYINIEYQVNNLLQSIQTYVSIKDRYNITGISELQEAMNSIEHNKQINNITIVNTDRIIRLCEELELYYKGYFAQCNLISINQKLDENTKELESLNGIISTYKTLSENARISVEQQTQRILKLYGSTIRRIYKYLNPNLRFSEFNIRIDTENPKNNRMIFEVTGINGTKMNPSYSFSAAQNNILAVSLFLSFAITQKWSNLNCIFMDDPIQNMDDINIHNFVDILRNIIKKTDKQIFISTHDERVFKYLKNKFRAYIQTFEFLDYGKIKSDSL